MRPFKALSNAEISRLAARLIKEGVCTARTFANWQNGSTIIGGKACKRIEELTKGKVTRRRLRPDMFA